jgi:hypothetical protein
VPLTVKTSGKALAVPPGILLKPMLTLGGALSGSDEEHRDFVSGLTSKETLELHAIAEYDEALGRYRMAALRVEVLGDGELTSVLLRGVKVQALLRLMAQRGVISTGGMDAAEFVESGMGSPDGYRGGGSAEALLRSIALSYRLAEIRNEPPAQAVAEELQQSPRTATNWIRRAREAGYFDG